MEPDGGPVLRRIDGVLRLGTRNRIVQQHRQAEHEGLTHRECPRLRDQEVCRPHEEVHLIRIAPDQHLMMRGVGHILHAFHQVLVAPGHDEDGQTLLDLLEVAEIRLDAAEAEGLGSCYNGNILNVMDQVSELLALPDRVFPVVMLTLGWPKTERRQPPKYPASLLVHENEYRERPDETVYAAYRKQNCWQKFHPKEEWVESCCTLAERLHGAEYAARVREDIEKKGYLGPYQYWFGCYYLEEPDFLTTEDYRNYFKKQGFHWLNAEGDIES